MKARALFLFAAVAAASFAAQDTYKFVRSYKLGEKDSYSVKVTASLSLGEIESRMTLVQEIVKVYDNGDADQKTSITSMRNLFNGNELPSQPGTGERTFVERITPAGGVAAKAGTANELNGMNELFTTGSRLAGKSFRVGEVVTINDVDPKEPRNKVTGTAKLESVVDGVAKVVSQLEISIAEQAKPMRASSTSWIEVSTSKMIKMEGKASGLIAGKGLDINEAKFTMERIH
ncbi:MAG: hypothetical protein WAO58_12645 [Fimbriimonadaceae bacterium]